MLPVGPLAESASPQGVLEARSPWAWWACLHLEVLVLHAAVGGALSSTAVASGSLGAGEALWEEADRGQRGWGWVGA